jgi:hypothetical protein
VGAGADGAGSFAADNDRIADETDRGVNPASISKTNRMGVRDRNNLFSRMVSERAIFTPYKDGLKKQKSP